jgi:uncharacterized protein
MRSCSLLALTGGGIMARFATKVLEDLQLQRNEVTGTQSAQAPLSEAFDLMAGTSAGALCVAGLAVGRSPAELSKLFDDHGQLIFPLDRRQAKMRWLMTAKYDPRPLYAAVDAALDGKNPRLGELSHNVAFPAIDESEGKPIIFSNSNPAYQEVPLRDAVLASAAAPTYFPAHRIQALGRRYVDGGLFASAPDFAALTIARTLWPHLSINDIHLLSIGTTSTSSRSPYGEAHPGAMGIYAWAARPPARILKLAMRSQVDHAMALLPELQLADFIRIDALLEAVEGETLELDNASNGALKALTEAGAKAVVSLPSDQRTRLTMLLGRRRSVLPL